MSRSISKLFLIIMFCLFNFVYALDSKSDSKKVLILFSYHQGYEWQDNMSDVIIDNLKDKNNVLYIEYLDAINIRSEKYYDLMEQMFNEKYKNIKFDLIITTDDNALRFVNDRKFRIDESSVIFCGINNFDKNNFQNLTSFTGVNESISADETINLALKLRPDTKKIVIISGSSVTTKRNLEIIRESLKKYQNHFEIKYLSSVNIDSLGNELRNFNESDLLLYITNLQRPNGESLTTSKSVEFIKQNTDAPIFGFWDFLIPYGLVGGKVVHSSSQALGLVKLAKRVLAGEEASNIPVIMESPNRFIFNGDILSKYDIKLQDLPNEALITNQQTADMLTKWETIKANSFFGYELFAGHGSVMMLIDPDTGLILDVNEAAKNFYGYEKLSGKLISEINTLTPQEVSEEMKKAKNEHRNYFDFRHKLANGDIRDVEVFSYPMDFNGKKLLFSIVIDITDKKLAEISVNNRNIAIFIISFIGLAVQFLLIFLLLKKNRNLILAKKSIIASEEKHEFLFDNMTQGVVYHDENGDLISVNRSACNILGLSNDELLSKNSYDPNWKTITEDGTELRGEDHPAMITLRTRKAVVDKIMGVYNRKINEYVWIKTSSFPKFLEGNDKISSIVVTFEDITSTVNYERVLKASESKYRQLFENIRQGFALHEMIYDDHGNPIDYRFLEVNPAFEELTHTTAKEIIGKRVLEVLPETEDYWITTYGEIATYGNSKTFENYTKSLNRYYEISAFSPEKGKFASVFSDITERKLSEIKLKESEEKFRSYLRNAPYGIFVVDKLGNFIEVNPKATTITGYSIDELIGMSIGDLLPDESKEFGFKHFSQVKNTGYAFGESKYRTKDGSIRWWSIAAQKVSDELYLGFTEDITERKQIEQELKDSEERFKALHNASFGGITIHDKGVIIDCNHGLSEITGYSFDELIGMNGLLLISEKSRDMVLQNILNGYEEPYEAIGVRKNGEEYFLRLEGRNIPYKGRIVRTVEFRDINIEKQNEKEKENLQMQLIQSQKLESIGRLAGGVAHDFNNMLSVILSCAELGLLKYNDEQLVRKRFEEIKKAALRSSEITKQLLSFARKQIISPVVVNLNDSITKFLSILDRLIGEDIEITCLPYDKLWKIKIDPTQIDQILTNLCVNSRDAIEDIGQITIETNNEIIDDSYCLNNQGFSPGEYVVLSFSDNGSGMDKDTKDKIFEPFFTTKEQGKGTGLGLPMIYGIVKQNNGFINVYSEVGVGTTFKIYFPKIDDIENRQEQLEDIVDVKGGKETILIVEDEELILDLATQMLEDYGYKILSSTSPFEAIKIVKNYDGKIDLLISDVKMPEMNGRDLAKKIMEKVPDLKLLFMSGYTENVIAKHGVLEDGFNFIQKPFSFKNLAEKVHHILNS
ncbi:MAG: PAS domain S-box protein [Candidatus Delongbacteria bacterium]|nr:PAS domain S-box protein [Candidatus Delongbacteria bacterium]MBN2836920.1 PAS domain S-box protein [Candidatus Delongbacteria bacterium]